MELDSRKKKILQAAKQLTADTDIMLYGMDRVCAGTAFGQPFENMIGSGAEYTFGQWSVLCRA